MPNQTPREQALLKELNDSGYGFQHAVVRAIVELKGPGWTVELTEFPVSIDRRPTHIDVVAWLLGKLVLVGECKRANPAFADWLFVKSPVTFKGRGVLRLDQIRRRIPDEVTGARANAVETKEMLFDLATPMYHIAFEVKTNAMGDSKGQGRTLREAVTQAQLAAQGMLSTLGYESDTLLRGGRLVTVLPVIFTTAKLFVANVDLSRLN